MKKLLILFIFLFILNIYTATCQEDSELENIRNSVVKLELFWSGNDIYSAMVEESNSLGVIISSEGHVLTCYHSITLSEHTASDQNLSTGQIADTINIKFNGKKESVPAKVIAIDEWRDMAILKPYEKIDLPIKTKINTGKINKNDIYYASIDPVNPWNSLSSGTLAYPVLNDNGRNVIGFNLNIKKGSSGSGIFDSSCNLVGLIYATGKLGSEDYREFALAVPGPSISLFLGRNDVPYLLSD